MHQCLQNYLFREFPAPINNDVHSFSVKSSNLAKDSLVVSPPLWELPLKIFSTLPLTKSIYKPSSKPLNIRTIISYN